MQPFRYVVASLVLAAVFVGLAPQPAAAESPRPNIIVIMSDDMGYSDIGCYGGEIETPHLDALAAGGLRFTQFYNTARCCPTRASLLTGLYPHQAGMGHMTGPHNAGNAKPKRPAYRGDLNRQCLTIAEALRPAGYRNYAVGKWHVTPIDGGATEHDQHNWPLQRGFDRFYGTIMGGGSFFYPATLTRDNEIISPYADPEYQSELYYYTDAISDNAVRFVNDHARERQDEPLFMYVAYTAAHWPMHAKDEDIAKYKGRYDAGYDAIREARYAKMKELGLIDQSCSLSPKDGGAWADVEHREFELRCMEVYAAMVDSMDQGIGRIVGSLRENGMLDNTLILFLQDNGGCAELMGREELAKDMQRANEPSLPPLPDDYLEPRLVPKQTRDGYPMRQGIGVLPGAADTYHGYGLEWANVSNTPFREYKHWVHEGGISTPLIAHWPAGIAARGELRRDPGHLIDLMATCVDLAGADYPILRDGKSITPLEGVSLRSAFAGEPLNRPEPIYFEHEGNRAVRDGQWKLVAKGPKGKWGLYDMAADRAELNDLAAEHPQRVRKMAAQWEAWAKRAGVLPWIWKPAYGRKQAVSKSPS
jgi:arylsulfatase A-like enzyme